MRRISSNRGPLFRLPKNGRLSPCSATVEDFLLGRLMPLRRAAWNLAKSATTFLEISTLLGFAAFPVVRE
jgi:hypothetical protein